MTNLLRFFMSFILVFSCMLFGTIYVVDQKHPSATDLGDSTQTVPFKTISKAALYAYPGDTILVKAGIYRERVAPVRSGTALKPVTFLADSSKDTVFIHGSEVVKQSWTMVDSPSNIYKVLLDSTLFVGYNPFHKRSAGLARLTLGQVFVNGKYLSETISSLIVSKKNSWYHDSVTDEIVVHFPLGTLPKTDLVEVATRSRVFAPHIRGLSYIVVKGFVIEHGGNQYPGMFDAVRDNAQSGLIGCRSGNHWIIEHNVIRFAKSIGLDFGNEGGLDNEGTQSTPAGVGYHLIQHNIVSDNGVSGMAAMSSRATRVIGNIIERNNIDMINVVENAGFKVHNWTDGVFTDNVIRYNYAYGVWFDSNWPNVRVSRNLFYGNKDNAMFFELGFGPALFDNNILVCNMISGLLGRDASGVNAVHNLFAKNSVCGIILEKPDGRVMGGKPVNVFNWKVYNNIFYNNGGIELRAIPDSGKVYNTFQKSNVFTPNKWIQFGTIDTPRVAYLDTLVVDTAGLTLAIKAKDTFFSIACSTFTSVTTDFNQSAFPTTNALCGPFQNLINGLKVNTLAIAGLQGSSISSNKNITVNSTTFKKQVSSTFVNLSGNAAKRNLAPGTKVFLLNGKCFGTVNAHNQILSTQGKDISTGNMNLESYMIAVPATRK